MKVLVFNCGSSSIKYQLFDMPHGEVLARGMLERIGQNEAQLTYSLDSQESVQIKKHVEDHDAGMKLINQVLSNGETSVIQEPSEIDGIGHRVVHGGESFSGSTLITNRVIEVIEEYVDLAPLHNPPNLAGIKAAKELFTEVPQVAVFDTAFHQTLPPKAYTYAVDRSLYKKYKIRKYGFHGTSHKFVANQAAELLGRPFEKVNLITCHLGNGCSMAAVKNGKSVDTTMGLTPLEGLVMGTRSGDIDPAIIFHLAQYMQLEKINELLNKKSGLLGLSGISNDVRDIKAAADSNNKDAKLALEVFCYRTKKYIGAYLAVLGHVDAVVFTGGIGENATNIREGVCRGLEPLGIELDGKKNSKVLAEEALISTDGSRIKVVVIPTNEEKIIASETCEVIGKE